MSPNTKPRPRLLSIDETALELHVSTKTIRRLIERGTLTARRINRCLRVSQDDLRLYLNQVRT